MPPAARLGDPTSHGGTLGPPLPPAALRVSTVLIENKPAAVAGSTHVCVIPPHALMGPANVVLPRPAATGLVLIGGLPAARVGDQTACGANIVFGAMTVQIGTGL